MESGARSACPSTTCTSLSHSTPAPAFHCVSPLRIPLSVLCLVPSFFLFLWSFLVLVSYLSFHLCSIFVSCRYGDLDGGYSSNEYANVYVGGSAIPDLHCSSGNECDSSSTWSCLTDFDVTSYVEAGASSVEVMLSGASGSEYCTPSLAADVVLVVTFGFAPSAGPTASQRPTFTPTTPQQTATHGPTFLPASSSPTLQPTVTVQPSVSSAPTFEPTAALFAASGTCSVSGACFYSPNYPNNYGNNDYCTTNTHRCS